MRERVCQVREERPTLLLADEFHSLFRVAFCERGLLGRLLDDLAIPNQWHIPAVFGRLGGTRSSLRQIGATVHVVRVGQPKTALKALIERPRSLMDAEVPLANVRGGVALLTQRFCNGDFIRR